MKGFVTALNESPWVCFLSLECVCDALSSFVPSELQLSLGHGAGRPGGGAVPAEREPGAEQEHVQLSLPGCDRQG